MPRTPNAAECPHCETPLTARERRANTCPSCGGKLDGTPQPGRTTVRGDGRSRTGRCELTGREVHDLVDGYVRVTRTTIAVGLGTASSRSRWHTVAVRCSEKVLNRGRAIKRNRILMAMAWMLPPLILVPLACLLEQFGADRGTIGLVAIPGFLLPIPLMAVGPAVVGPMVRRGLRSLLASEVDEKLRSLNGGEDWGVKNEVLFVRDLDPGETAIPLSQLP